MYVFESWILNVRKGVNVSVNGCLCLVLTLQEIYPGCHPITAGIGSIPVTLNWIDISISTYLKKFCAAASAPIKIRITLSFLWGWKCGKLDFTVFSRKLWEQGEDLSCLFYLNYSVFPRVKHILQIKCSQLGAPVWTCVNFISDMCPQEQTELWDEYLQASISRTHTSSRRKAKPSFHRYQHHVTQLPNRQNLTSLWK